MFENRVPVGELAYSPRHAAIVRVMDWEAGLATIARMPGHHPLSDKLPPNDIVSIDAIVDAEKRRRADAGDPDALSYSTEEVARETRARLEAQFAS